MKTPKILTASITLSALIAAFGVLGSTSSTLAQAKGGELLANVRHTSAAPALQNAVPTATTSMASCPNCKDKWVAVAQPPGKGGRAEMAMVAKHQCPSCATRVETVGVGKQATSSVKHVCQGGTEGAGLCAPAKAAGNAMSPAEHDQHHH